MKIEELTKLGIAEDAAKQVIALSEQELADATKKYTDRTAELKAANDNLAALNEKVKAFDGVDVEKLKADLAAAEKQRTEEIAALKLDNAVELALGGSGALDKDIVKGLIDKQVVKLGEDGKLLGLGEQLEKIKTDKPFLFGGDKPPEADGGARIDTGLDHSGVTEAVTDAQARAVMGLPEITK